MYRRELARVVQIGLLPYAVRMADGNRFSVQYAAPVDEESASPLADVRDPWNFWVFRTSVNGNLGGERSNKNRSYRLNLSANRVTENWKINLSTNGNYNENTFEIDDEGTTIKSVSRTWGVNTLAVKSLGEHWSAGLRRRSLSRL